MTRKLVIALVVWLCSAATLSAQDNCPPKPETWPPTSDHVPGLWWTPFSPRFHGATFALRCNFNPATVDLGSLKCEGGKWKVYGVGSVCDGLGWCDYDSRHPGQSFWTNVYSRYGCGPSGGHGHGIDAYVYPAEDYEKATGKPLIFNSMPHIDTWFHPTLYKWIDSEARKKEGPLPLCPNRVCDPSEDSRSCPQDCIGVVRPITVCGNGNCETGEDTSTCPTDCPRQLPINPNCNMICSEGDRVCSAEGNLVGGKCPTDCDPCEKVNLPTTTVECPPCDTLGCATLIDAAKLPLESELLSCHDKTQNLSRILDFLIIFLREERTRAINGGVGICTRYNRSITQICSMFTCPADLVRIVCRRTV